jgi:hypothetical protein
MRELVNGSAGTPEPIASLVPPVNHATDYATATGTFSIAVKAGQISVVPQFAKSELHATFASG